MADLQLSSCRVDLETGEVHPGDGLLTARERELLAYLAQRSGQVVQRTEILREAFGYAPGVVSRAVEKTMLTLRKKVERDPSAPEHLLTRGAGYLLEPASSPQDLPHAPPLVGRVRELAALQQRLSAPGLCTLLGPGGVGKTALAQHAARTHAHGSGFVAMCAAGHPEGLLAQLAVALGAPPQLEAVGCALAARVEPLVVVDGAERDLEPLELLDRLVPQVPRLRVLVTSRVATGRAREHLLRIEPLSPEEAIDLLLQRASALGCPIPPSPAARALVERLDRLPLAIELMAPRLEVLGPEDLLRRLPAQPEPGSVLREVMDRSWAPLDPVAQRALCELTVLCGPFSAEDAEAVLSSPADGRSRLDVLELLVRRSLIQRRGAGGSVLLHLLDLVKSHAASQGPADARSQAASRHLDHFLSRGDEVLREGRLLDNLVAATEGAISRGEPERALACLARLREIAMFGSLLPLSTLRRLCCALLDAAGTTGPMAARARAAHAIVRFLQGELAAAEQELRGCLPHLEGADLADALLALGRIRVCLGDAPGAAQLYDEVEPLIEEPKHLGSLLLGQSAVDELQGRLREALARAARADRVLTEAGLLWRALQARISCASLLSMLGELEEAQVHSTAALQVCRSLGATALEARLEGQLTAIAATRLDSAAYVSGASRLVEIYRRSGQRDLLCRWLSNLGNALTEDGQLQRAEPVLLEALALAADLPPHRAHATLGWSGLLARQGRIAEAITASESSRDQFDALGRRHEVIAPLCLLARLLHAVGRPDEAERAVTRAVRLAEELGLGPHSDKARHIEATLEALRDHSQTSRMDGKP